MNYRIKRLFTYVVILGLLGCKLGENSNSYTGFPDIISLSAVERDLALLLGNPNEVLILGNEYVIKDNKSDFILHFFNRNDHGHLGSFVRKGNGPSEETMIQALAHVDDNSLIYKTLEGLTRIAYDISSNKVELIETWDVPMDFLTVAYPFDSSKVLGWNYSMHPGEFLLYNPLTEIFTDFGDGFSFREQKLSIEESHRIFGNKQITVKPGNRYFAASYMAIPIVRIFDAQTGEIVKELTTKQNYDFPFALINRNASREDMMQIVENYYSITSTEKYIYVLYSGKTKGELYPGMLSGDFKIPDFGNEIHVWDWAGNPIKKLVLDRSILSFDVNADDDQLLAISVNNPGKVYVYALE